MIIVNRVSSLFSFLHILIGINSTIIENSNSPVVQTTAKDNQNLSSALSQKKRDRTVEMIVSSIGINL